MTCTDVISIIEAGKKNGVRSIVVSDKSIKVEYTDQEIETYHTAPSFIDNNSNKIDNVISEDDIYNELLEEQLNDLMLSDPLEYERRIKEMAQV